MSKLIRLKPYDPKKGHVIRRYTAFGVRFDEARGWYKVSDEVAAYLASVHQRPGDDDSPAAFDVCTDDEAKAMEAVEKKKAEERARAAEPNVAQPHDVSARPADLTTADLPHPRSARATAGSRRG